VRRSAVLALVLSVLVAGCAAKSGGAGSGSGAGESSLAAAQPLGTGAVRGVVVDEAIRPVPNATVALSGNHVNKTVATAADGIFEFDAVPPGTYFLRVTSLLFGPVQSAVAVDAGKVSTPKVQLQHLFAQAPYHESTKFDGFIQCGYSVSGAISSICVNDYTHFVGPTTCPQCEHLVDSRGTIFTVGAGWQTQVDEMFWDPSASGTSAEMAETISFYPRVASHWYCQAGGPSPVLMRLEVNVTCEQSQGTPQPFPPEGLNNTYIFASTSAPAGQPASFTVSQRFTMILSTFYYGKPPAGWSFVAGDPYPF